MSNALRSSELFAIRWRTFNDANTLDLTDLATELRQWNLECPDPSPKAFMFPNADGGFMDTSNYRSRALKPPADALSIPKLNFQVIRRTIATGHRVWVQ